MPESNENVPKASNLPAPSPGAEAPVESPFEVAIPAVAVPDERTFEDLHELIAEEGVGAAGSAVGLQEGDAGTEQLVVEDRVYDTDPPPPRCLPDARPDPGEVARVHDVGRRPSHEGVEASRGRRHDRSRVVHEAADAARPPVAVVQRRHPSATRLGRIRGEDLDLGATGREPVSEAGDVALGAAGELVGAVGVDEKQPA